LLALGGFLVPLLLAISWGRDNTTAVSTLFLLSTLALVGGTLFILRELLAMYPAVTLRLFRSRAFCLICSTAFLNSMGLFGAQFMVPIFLQQVMGFTPLQAGLVIVPALVAAGLSGVLTGRMSDMMPPPFVILGGVVALLWVFYGFSSFTALTATSVLVGYIVLYRICMFAVFTPLTALNVQVLETDQVRMGQGLMGVVRNIGASLGVTVTSVLFERQRVSHQLMAYHNYDAASTSHTAALDELKHLLHQGGIAQSSAEQAALSTIKQQMDVEAVAAAFRDSFLLVGGFFLLASLPMFCMLHRRLSGTDKVYSRR
jgi:DHA2 family multidrug resistance protein